jgi:hypothetical protein
MECAEDESKNQKYCTPFHSGLHLYYRFKRFDEQYSILDFVQANLTSPSLNALQNYSKQNASQKWVRRHCVRFWKFKDIDAGGRPSAQLRRP